MQSVERILALLNDPTFWVVSIFFGLLLNVLSNFVTKALEKRIATFSTGRQLQLERKQRAQEDRVAYMAATEERIAQARHWEIRMKLNLLMVLVVIVAFWPVATSNLGRGPVWFQAMTIICLISILAIFISVFRMTWNMKDEVMEAEHLRRQRQSEEIK